MPKLTIEPRLRPLRPHPGAARRHHPGRRHRSQLRHSCSPPRFSGAAAISRSSTPPRCRCRTTRRWSASGNSPFIAIPVYPSRVFRHGYFFINTDKGIKSGADLKGKRGGVPEYSMTAAVYMRGLMQHEFGVKPSDVEWVQGRADRLGRKLPVRHQADAGAGRHRARRPAGARRDRLHDDGEQPAVVPPRRARTCARLFPNYAEMEKDYYRRTKIYPIMHTVVIRRDIYDRDPWVALNLYKALCRAKDCCYQQLTETGSPKASFAWLQPMIEEEQAIIGEDWYPYGIEQNRPIDRGAAAIHPRARPDRPPRQARGAVRAGDHARHSAERGAAGLARIN